MNCRQIHRHLLAWIEGELDEATWLSVAQHLEGCEKCQMETERLRRVIETLRVIANSDDISPIPQRLWRKLIPQRKRLPSFAAIFVTACLAFLIGWHARGIASSNQSFQVNALGMANVSAKIEQGQSTKPKSNLNFRSNLENPSAKILNIKSPRRGKQMFSGRLFSVPTVFRRSQSLMLSGATALAWGEKVLSNRLGINFGAGIDKSLSSQFDLAKDSVSDKSQLAENDAEPVADFVLVFLPVETPQPTEPQPYRIFVQVTDSETQTVRTIKVDTTEPQHIVAEWSEISNSEISR